MQSFQLVNSEQWYDIGNIKNYYKAKIDFLKVRSFNSVTYNDMYGTLKKTSSNVQKIQQEINWYINLPYELKIFTPRLVDYRMGDSSWYEIEYYGYQSLGDLFLFGYLGESMWKSIIDKLFAVQQVFKKYTTLQPYAFFYEMYVTKTRSRIQELEKQQFFSTLLSYETISINGKIYRNLPFFLELLDSCVERLYILDDISCIHGDFCLSNILYDTNNNILKLIDPRGYFGEYGIYGDVKYDLAKMRHSLV